MGGSRSVGGYDNEALFKDERELAIQGQPGQRMEECGVCPGTCQKVTLLGLHE